MPQVCLPVELFQRMPSVGTYLHGDMSGAMFVIWAVRDRVRSRALWAKKRVPQAASELC